MRSILAVLVSFAFTVSAVGQVALRLLENPLQGASAQFGVSGAPFRQFLFVMAAAEGGSNQLSAFDPRDLRTVGFDIRAMVFVSEGALDSSGLAQVVVPAAYLTAFRTTPFFSQVLTFPGPATLIDELSNTVSQRVGTGTGGICGFVRDETDRPLDGATITLVGNASRTTTSLATDGRFSLSGLPPGRRHLIVDGRHLAPPPGFPNHRYPRVEIPVDVVDGLVTAVPFIVYLPKATGGTVVPAGVITTSTVVTAPTPEGNLRLVIDPGTIVRYAPGTLASEPVTMVRVDTTRTPMPMPRDLRPQWDFAVYPPSVAFSQPADVTLVTTEVLQPGSEWDLMRPNHENMTFVFAGRMRAQPGTNGGTVLTLIPNSGPGGTRGGVIGGGWHSVARPPFFDPFSDDPPPCPPGTCCPEDTPAGDGCRANLGTGDLSGEVRTATFLAGGREERLTFVYRSHRAHPILRFQGSGSMPSTAMVPQYLSLEASLGARTSTPLFYNPAPVGNGAHALVAMLDAVSVPSGVHACELMSRSHYGQSNFAATAAATKVVENHVDSPFGAGWTLSGLDRVVRTIDGAMLSRGSGAYTRFAIPAGSGVFAGTGTAGSAGNGGRAEFAQLSFPIDLAADVAGNTYVLDGGTGSIRVIDRTGIIRLFAGTPGSFGSTGDGGDRLACTFDFRLAAGAYAGGLAVDEARQRLYVADANNHRVRYVDLQTNLVHAFAGNGQPGFSGDNGAAMLARLRQPSSVTVDGLGRVWIADTGNHCIRMVSADGSRVLTVAGIPLQPGYSGEGGPAWQARVSGPTGLAVDPFGVIYFADRGNHLVRRITNSGRIERYLGTGTPGLVVNGTSRLQAAISGPADVAVDPSGQVFVAAADGRQIVRVDAGELAQVLWPAPGTSGPVASSIEIAEDGVVVFGESSRHRIHRVEVNGLLPLMRSPDETLRRSFAGGYVHVRPDQSRAVFDALGRMTSVVDPAGRVRRFHWLGTSELLDRIELETGQVFAFGYDPQGKLATVTDPAGRVCRATIQNGDLVRWEAPGPDAVTPATTVFTYEGNSHFVTSMTAPGGTSVTQLTRNALQQYTGALQTGVGLGTGRQWSNEPLGYRAAPGVGQGTPGSPIPAAAPSDRMSWTDPGGHQHSMAFDRVRGVVTSTTDPLGNRTDYSFDGLGRMTQRVRPGAGAPTTTWVYDGVGRVLQRSEPMGRVWRYEYGTPFPAPTRITDPRGKVTTFELHPLHGRPVVVTDPTGFPTSYSYDARGRLTLVSQPYEGSVRTTALAYDAQDRVVSITDPLGGTRRFTYYPDGQLHESFDELQSRTAFTYTPAGDVATRTDALGFVTTFRHDVMGMLSEIIDAKTNPGPGRTQFRYDAVGQLVERIDPLGALESFSYDGNGNRTRWTTRNGDTITYVYDARNTLLRKRLGTTSLATFEYDERGNMLRADNASARLGFAYDEADRLLTADTTGSSHQQHGVLTYSYDTADNVTGVSGYGYAVSRTYDDRNLLVAVADNLGASVAFPRDPLGRRTGIQRNNGVNTVWQRDRSDRLSEIRHLAVGGASTIASWTYVRDAVGNPEQVHEDRAGVFARGTNSYAYDAKHELVTATHPDARLRGAMYAYDPVGNRLYNGSASVDSADRLTTDMVHTFAYDPRGNLVNRTVISTGAVAQFVFDAEGQMTEVLEFSGPVLGPPLQITRCFYDALGRRVRREKVGVVAQDLTYQYDGLHMHCVNHGNGGTGFGFLRGDLVDEWIGSSPIVSPAVTYYLASDARTVEHAVDALGGLRGSRLVSPFGEFGLTVGFGRLDERLVGFTGRETEDFGMVFHRARYYLPSSGRFAGEDRLWMAIGSSYGYAVNNPMKYLDWNGLQAAPVSTPAPGLSPRRRQLCESDPNAVDCNPPVVDGPCYWDCDRLDVCSMFPHPAPPWWFPWDPVGDQMDKACKALCEKKKAELCPKPECDR